MADLARNMFKHNFFSGVCVCVKFLFLFYVILNLQSQNDIFCFKNFVFILQFVVFPTTVINLFDGSIYMICSFLNTHFRLLYLSVYNITSTILFNLFELCFGIYFKPSIRKFVISLFLALITVHVLIGADIQDDETRNYLCLTLVCLITLISLINKFKNLFFFFFIILQNSILIFITQYLAVIVQNFSIWSGFSVVSNVVCEFEIQSSTVIEEEEDKKYKKQYKQIDDFEDRREKLNVVYNPLTSTKAQAKLKTKSASKHSKKHVIYNKNTSKASMQQSEKDIQNLDSSIDDYKTMMSLEETFHSFDINLRFEETQYSNIVHNWMKPLKMDRLPYLLTICLNFESDVHNTQYTVRKRELINAAMKQWCNDQESYEQSLYLLLALTREMETLYVPDETNMVFHSTCKYSYCFERWVCLQPYDYGKFSDKFIRDQPNIFHQLLYFPNWNFTYGKMVGVIKSLKSKHDTTSDTMSALNDFFAPVSRILTLNARKNKFEYVMSKHRKKIWFINLLPKDYFFIEHESDQRQLHTFLENKVNSLRKQIFDFAKMYYQVGSMSHEDRRKLAKARVQTFREIMRTAEVQFQFLANRDRKSICDDIYVNRKESFLPDKLATFDNEAVKEHVARKRVININRARRNKIQDQNEILHGDFEPHSFVEVIESTSFVFTYLSQGLLSLVGSFFNNILHCTSVYAAFFNIYAAYRLYRARQQIHNIVNSWNIYNYVSLDRQREPEKVLFLLEIKTLIHILYELYYGSEKQAALWASNLLITRSKDIVDIIPSLHHCVNFANRSARTTEGDMEIQSGLLLDVFSSLAVILAKSNLGNFSAEDLRQANAQFAYVNNCKNQANQFATTVGNIINIISKFLFNYDINNPVSQAFSYKLLKCIKYTQKWATIKPTLTAHYQEIVDEYLQYKDLRQDAMFNDVPSNIKSLFVESFRKLEELAESSHNILIGNVPKPEPVCLFVAGVAGTGKTTLTNNLVRLLSRNLNIAKDTYGYKVGTQFMEGYTGQNFFLMDDIFTTTDVKARQAEALSVINMVNTSPYALDMAFGGKGKVYFKSQFIFITSNAMKEGERLDAGMTDTGAFLRRLHIRVERNEQAENDVHDTFKVVQCIHFPQYEGKDFNIGQLANLILKVKQVNQQNHEARNSDLLTPVDMIDLNRNEFSLQPQNNQVQIPSVCDYITLYVEVTPMGTVWWKPEWYQIVVILFMLLVTMKFVYSYIFPGSFEEQNAGSTHSSNSDGHVNLNKSSRHKWGNLINSRGHNRYKRVDMPNEAHFMHQTESVTLSEKISNCIVYVLAYGVNEDGNNLITNCLATHIKDNIFMFPAHFLDQLENVVLNRVVFHTAQGEYNVEIPQFTSPDVVGMNGVDIAFIRVCLPQKPSEAYKFLLPKGSSVIEDLVPGTRLSMYCRNTNTAYVKQAVQTSVYTSIDYQVCGNKYSVQQPLSYSTECQPGDSGAPIVYVNHQGQYLIVGLHSGRVKRFDSFHGIALRLTQTSVDFLTDQFQPQSGEFPLEIDHRVEQGMSIPTRTRLRKTRMFGYRGKPTCIPAYLSSFVHDEVEFNPRVLALNKLHQVFTDPTPVPASVMSYLFNMYPRKEEYLRILNVDEALIGISELGIPSIDATTSPGYPYSIGKNTKGKAPYVVTVDGRHTYQPEVRSLILEYDEKLRNGQNIPVYWADMLKDETRPIEKVLKGKTRIFSACPLHYLILVRMYFQTFVSYVQSLAAIKPVSVGINPHSSEWQFLYNRFSNRNGWKIVAGDFSNYDGKLPAFVGKIFVDFVNRWYGDSADSVNGRVRYMLMEHVFNPMRLHETIAYKVCDGNPSGNPITSIYNSFCNIIMCYTIFVMDFKLRDNEFDLAVYGDDNILYFKSDEEVTSDLLSVKFKERFDMDYTHFSKTQTNVIDNIHTIQYLGRSFRPSRFGVQAPLDLQVIFESLYWRRGSQELEKEIIVNAMSNFALELSHYDTHTFTKEIQNALDAIRIRHDEFTFELCTKAVKSYLYYQNHKYMDQVLTYTQDVENSLVEGFNSYSSFIPDSNVVVTSELEETKTTQNTDYTLKSANQIRDTQQVQLGAYQDAAPITSSAVDTTIIQSPYAITNMETFNLSNVLNREFPIGTYSWTTSAAPGAYLATIDFPGALLTQGFIIEKIKDFRYLKAGIRLTFRLSSTTFNFGSLCAAFIPDPTSDTYYSQRISTAKLRSGFPHILLSAASSEVAVLDIPFIWKWRAVDLINPGSNSMGRVIINVLNKLTNINGAVSQTDLFVTAQFTHAELFLPFEPNSSLANLNGKPSQRRKISSEGFLKGINDSISSRFVDNIVETAKTINTGFISPFADLYNSIIKPSMHVAAIAGLDKPTSLSRTQVSKLNPYSDISNSRGIDTCSKLGVDPENHISTQPVVGGVSTDEHDLVYIVGTPMLVNTQTIGNSTLIGSGGVLADLNVLSSPQLQGTYTEFMCQNFRFWSGSMKMKLYIFASQMHACRIAVYINHVEITQPNDWMQCYHRVIDIQGDTEVDFLIPYLSSYPTISGVNYNFGVYYKVLAYSQAQEAIDTPIYINVYHSMASDVQFGLPVETIFQVQSNPRLDFQTNFEPFHPSMTGYNHKGLLFGEEIHTYKDLIHRYVPIKDRVNGNVETIYAGTGNVGPKTFTGLEYYGLIFRWWRGSIRLKQLQKDAHFRMAGYYILGNLCLGNTFSSNMNPLLEYEIPYYDDQYFRSTTKDSPITDVVVCPNNPDYSTYTCKAAGDDFSFHFLVPPPPIVVYGTTGFGTAGLIEYYTPYPLP